MIVVVDASAVLAYLLAETQANTDYASHLIEQSELGNVQLIAPSIMRAECAHVLLRKRRASRWGDAKTAEYAEVIDFLRIRYVSIDTKTAAHVRFASRHNV